MHEGHDECTAAVETLAGFVFADASVDDEDAVARAAFILADDENADEEEDQQAADDEAQEPQDITGLLGGVGAGLGEKERNDLQG